MHNIAKNIKMIRKQKGWTQQHMADYLFVTRQTVSNWENGKSMPDLDTIEYICEKLEIKSEYLLYGKLTQEKYRKLNSLTFALFLIGLIVLFLFVENISLVALSRISDYAGYDILRINEGKLSFSELILVMSVWTAPIWLVVLILNWIIADNHTLVSKTIKCITNAFLSLLLVCSVYSAVGSSIYTFNRYKNVVGTANERFELQDNLNGMQTSMYYDMGWRGSNLNQLVYIDNGDEKTDRFIDYLIASQALKIYRVDADSEIAIHLMEKHCIKNAPAVIIVHEGNAEVLEGYERISAQLETKIHNYKMHNIFFY